MPDPNATPPPAPEDAPPKGRTPAPPREEPRPGVEEDIGSKDDDSDFDATDLSDDPSQPKRPSP